MMRNRSFNYFLEVNNMFSNKLHSAGLVNQVGHLFLGLILSVWVYTANAAAIIDQLPFNGGNAYQSNWTGGSQYADNFSLTAEFTLTSIQWWGSYLPNEQGEDDFKVRIFSDAGGSPGVIPLAEYSSPSISPTGTSYLDSGLSPVFSYELLSLNLTLQAGNYYLSIINNEDNSAANHDTPSNWLWLQSGTVDQEAWNRQLDGETWGTAASVQGPPNFSFTLNGTQQQQPIPEPGILSLFALGALAMIGRRKFLRRSTQ
jgi:hypothetical protein